MQKTGNNADNPYTPLELIEEETKPGRLLGCVHIALIVLAIPLFLISLLFLAYDPVAHEAFGEGYRYYIMMIVSITFIVGYFGIFFRKEWAYWLCVIMPGVWTIVGLLNAFSNPHIRGMAMLTWGLTIHSWIGAVLLLAIICALNRRRQQKHRCRY